MPLEVITHLDKKYLVNYKIKLRNISPEEVEIVKDRTASPVVIQSKKQLFFAEEICEANFEDVVDPPKEITKEIQPKTQIIKFDGPPKKKTKKTKKIKKKKVKKKKKST